MAKAPTTKPASRTIEVKVERDHLERLAVSKSPVSAVAELIWNALDADATEVQVAFSRNKLGGIDSIEVSDNGHGLSHEHAVHAFERLGGSLKRDRPSTPGGRFLHGEEGKGRFQAFALGDHVQWSTCYRDNGTILEYRIQGDRASLHQFTVDDPRPSRSAGTGTVAKVTGVGIELTSVESPRAHQVLAEDFALYLRQYAGITVVYDGKKIDPSALEAHVEDYLLSSTILSDGREVSASLTVVEWAASTERALFLCDANGFSLHRVQPGIHARGFAFTAYLRSAFIRELSGNGGLALEELNPDLRQLIEKAKEQLRDHFRKRAAENAGTLVDQWKNEKVYPYEGTPKNIIEQVERQVFDVLALNVHDYLPDFEETSQQNRKLSFRLLRTAIETSPEAVQLILRDVLDLPQEKQEEFAHLLERTSLESIINASKVVADRLDFLRGLEILVLDPIGKQKTLERQQLHKIVAEHTWLFGEEFNLTTTDRSLTAVLERHCSKAGVEILDAKPVVREDGSQGIIDLMLSRVVPQPRADQNEHLIIELKRPSVKIGNEEATQVKEYAAAIVKDDRFRDTKTRWEFWVVSNHLTETVRLEANQNGRPPGLLWDLKDYKIWVKTWGEIINDCQARLRFFRDRLQYAADEGSGLDYLKRIHGKYLPKEIAEREPPATQQTASQ